MLTAEELENLPQYKYDIKRARIRFSGIGPLFKPDDFVNNDEVENQNPNRLKIWPRDAVKPDNETRMIMTEFEGKIAQDKKEEIRTILWAVFERLRLCNINNLYKKYAYHQGHSDPFEKVAFNLSSALDSDTSYGRIVELIKHILRSINSPTRTSTNPPGCHNGYVNYIFGSQSNFDILMDHIIEIVRGCSKFFSIRVADLICCKDKPMDLNKVTWLDGLEVKIKYGLYIQLMWAIMRYVMEFMRRFFYITKGSQTGDKLFYYGYDIWRKVQDYAIKEFIAKQVIERIDNYKSEVEGHTVSVSKMRFHLKSSGLRPICIGDKRLAKQYFIKKKNDMLFAILDSLLKDTRYEKFSLNNLLEDMFRYKKSLNDPANPKKVYIVRTDIKDCFQSIKQDLLYEKLCTRLTVMMTPNNNQVVLKRIFFKLNVKAPSDLEEVRMRIVTKYRWVLDENIDQYAKKEGFGQKETAIMNLEEVTQLLADHIKTPILVESSRSGHGYLLRKGIRQGSSFSPILSDIYIQAAFDEHLIEYLTSSTCKLFRYVDDILFISTDLEESRRFMHQMLKGFQNYDLRMNINKLSCNFKCQNLPDHWCRISDYAIFYKQRIWLDNLECSPHYDTKKLSLHYVTGALPYTVEENLVMSIQRPRLRQIHLDSRLNGEDRLATNIFEISLWFAHRIGTTMLVSFSMKRHQANQNATLLGSLAKQTSRRIWRAMRATRRCKNKRDLGKPLTQLFVSLLVFSAFICTWRRKQLCHRRRELYELVRIQKRLRIKMLTLRVRSEEECKHWAEMASSLMKKFVHSDFYKLVKMYQSADKYS